MPRIPVRQRQRLQHSRLIVTHRQPVRPRITPAKHCQQIHQTLSHRQRQRRPARSLAPQARGLGSDLVHGEERAVDDREEMRAEGFDLRGPLPADTMFHDEARRRYDVAICMYHDQALIPIKTVDFDGGVNVTLGLPFIRTSPDHGTAYDIAGQGRASVEATWQAFLIACRMGAARLC